MTQAWAQHLVFLVVATLERASHVRAEVTEGHNVAGRSNPTVGGDSKLDQEIGRLFQRVAEVHQFAFIQLGNLVHQYLRLAVGQALYPW